MTTGCCCLDDLHKIYLHVRTFSLTLQNPHKNPETSEVHKNGIFRPSETMDLNSSHRIFGTLQGCRLPHFPQARKPSAIRLIQIPRDWQFDPSSCPDAPIPRKTALLRLVRRQCRSRMRHRCSVFRSASDGGRTSYHETPNDCKDKSFWGE